MKLPCGTCPHTTKKSPSRSEMNVTIMAKASIGLAASAVSTQRRDFFSLNGRLLCGDTLPCRASTLARPQGPGNTLGIKRKHGMQQQAPAAALLDFAQVAAIVLCRRELQLAGVLQRQNVATLNRKPGESLQPSINRSTVTASLRRKRPYRISKEWSPLASWRRQTVSCSTMHRSSATPLFRGDDPRNEPNDHSWYDCISDTPANQNVIKRITQNSARESDTPRPSKSVAPKMCICPSVLTGRSRPAAMTTFYTCNVADWRKHR